MSIFNKVNTKKNNKNYCNLLLYYTWQSNRNKYCRNISLTSQTDLTKYYTVYISDN